MVRVPQRWVGAGSVRDRSRERCDRRRAAGRRTVRDLLGQAVSDAAEIVRCEYLHVAGTRPETDQRVVDGVRNPSKTPASGRRVPMPKRHPATRRSVSGAGERLVQPLEILDGDRQRGVARAAGAPTAPCSGNGCTLRRRRSFRT